MKNIMDEGFIRMFRYRKQTCINFDLMVIVTGWLVTLLLSFKIFSFLISPANRTNFFLSLMGKI